MRLVRLSPALIGAVLLSTSVIAQSPAVVTTASKTAHAQVVTTSKTVKTNVPAQRTAKSLDCSKQADGKNLHGKAHKSFMSSCKKA